jgi:hypothetical protein
LTAHQRRHCSCVGVVAVHLGAQNNDAPHGCT